jgi:hypothetical protein
LKSKLSKCNIVRKRSSLVLQNLLFLGDSSYNSKLFLDISPGNVSELLLKLKRQFPFRINLGNNIDYRVFASHYLFVLYLLVALATVN